VARPVYMAREDPEKMKEALDVFLKATVEPLLQRLEQRLIENGSGFLIGDKVVKSFLKVFKINITAIFNELINFKNYQLTWADLVLFNTCGGLR